MIKFVILISGLLLLIFHQYIQAISLQLQFIFFLIGIVLIGVPHGAADLLVASQNAMDEKRYFSKFKFLLNYLVRLLLFALILYLLPWLGHLLFILFAAYHFGETDLHQFQTNTLVGKFFMISYGLVILGIILLNHFEEVKPLCRLLDSSVIYLSYLELIEQHRYLILTFLGLLLFISSLLYFFINNHSQPNQRYFWVQFGGILFLLSNLPMLLGFTFYFIVWHSVLSLCYIVGYLQKDGLFSMSIIAKQIGIYSTLAIFGVVLFGLTGFMFSSNNAMIVYIFLGLAVLTAPHMQIMHTMYNAIRAHRTSNSNA
jgi:beta-carotene 15,15'-dioxygenase